MVDDLKENDSLKYEEGPIVEEEESYAPPRVFIRFFLVPLALVIGVLGIYLGLGLIFSNEKKPEDLIRDLRSSYTTTREHALYDLTFYIQRHPEARNNAQLMTALLDAYQHRRDFRPEIRVYIVMALGHMKNPKALPYLVEGLQDPDPKMLFYTIWALGKLGDNRAVKALLPFLHHSDPGIREITVIAFRGLQNHDIALSIRPLLEDESPSVRMNTVFTLALLGDEAALPGLHRLLDRSFVEQLPGVTEEKVVDILINALTVAMAFPNDEGLNKQIRKLHNDPSLKVRDAAMKFAMNKSSSNR